MYKFSQTRKIARFIRLISGVLIGVYFYSPLSNNILLFLIIKAIILPVVSISGLWMWKGYLFKKSK
jgi:hypothetical protein